MFLRGEIYIQRDIGGTGKESPLNLDWLPTMLEVLIWFQYVKMATNATADKTLSV